MEEILDESFCFAEDDLAAFFFLYLFYLLNTRIRNIDLYFLRIYGSLTKRERISNSHFQYEKFNSLHPGCRGHAIRTVCVL
jgi:hypothetical protein